MNIIEDNNHVILQNPHYIFCYKIEKNKNIKIFNFRISLKDFIGLHYDSFYVYCDGKFTRSRQSTYDDKIVLNNYNESYEENKIIIDDQIISNEIARSNTSFVDRSEYSNMCKEKNVKYVWN
ncbi:unnamed protein product [Gordionus sp. m RMFG-2023]